MQTSLDFDSLFSAPFNRQPVTIITVTIGRSDGGLHLAKRMRIVENGYSVLKVVGRIRADERETASRASTPLLLVTYLCWAQNGKNTFEVNNILFSPGNGDERISPQEQVLKYAMGTTKFAIPSGKLGVPLKSRR